MQKPKVKNQTFNDGLLEFGEVRTNRDPETLKVIGHGFVVSGELFYTHETIRQGDVDFYGGLDQGIDLKIKTHYVTEWRESMKVRIKDELYDVTAMSPSNDRRELYWYLSKI